MAKEGSLGEAMEWVVLVFVVLALVMALLGGAIVGCQASLQRNDRVNVQRSRYQAQKAFYQLCKRYALAGVLPLPRRCPR